jgi:hypothetical protein
MSRVAVVVVIAFASLVGCSGPDDSTFQPVAPPADLAESTTTTTSPTTLPPTLVPTTTVPTEIVGLYFVAGNQLRKTERSRPRGISLADVLDLLAAGPVTEPGLVLRSAIPSAPRVLNRVIVSGGVATVDLAPAVRDLPRQEQLLLFGQVVLTLTERPNVGQIRFTLAGSPLAAFLPDGSQRDGAVTKEDYQILLTGLPASTTVAPSTTATTAAAPSTTAASPPDVPPPVEPPAGGQ